MEDVDGSARILLYFLSSLLLMLWILLIIKKHKLILPNYLKAVVISFLTYVFAPLLSTLYWHFIGRGFSHKDWNMFDEGFLPIYITELILALFVSIFFRTKNIEE
jgi:hypothetical protein